MEGKIALWIIGIVIVLGILGWIARNFLDSNPFR